ncbi:MAG: M24 family metallopeptidase [Actinobacteria bacterium]|nr:M24 family metallopeptidase [Actinomycetota bacterium]
MSGFSERIEKIRHLADAKGLEAIVLRRNPNLAWAIGGRVHVPVTLDQACFDLIVTATSVVAVANAIEAPRLIAEEFPERIDVIVIPWWEGRDPHLPNGSKIGSDQPGGERIDLGADIEKLRQSLVAEDVERLRVISRQTAVVLGKAMREIQPDDREIDVAGRITSALYGADLDVVFMGVGGEERVRKFRHPLPTTAPIGNRVIASICSRRKGLIASTTRIVTFGELSSAHYEEYLNILAVESAILGATRIGEDFSRPIEAAVAAYPANGFDAEEWTNHHQGGPMGYLPRDWPANRTSTQKILPNQAIAWNPTGKGWKGEDTILTTASGIEILTVDPTWPSLTIDQRLRPDILRR